MLRPGTAPWLDLRINIESRLILVFRVQKRLLLYVVDDLLHHVFWYSLLYFGLEVQERLGSNLSLEVSIFLKGLENSLLISLVFLFGLILRLSLLFC